MQLLVEREVNAMVSLSGQREQEGKAGKSTRQLTYRLTATRKKIHDLMSAWMALHTLGKPGAAPPIYEEEDVLANILPWQPTSGRSGMVTQQQLELRLYQVECELMRCTEELEFLPHDAVRCLLFYQRQIAMMQAWLLRHGAQIDGWNMGKLMLMHNTLLRLERVKSHAVSVFVGCGWVVN
jgi:hypothetical protein